MTEPAPASDVETHAHVAAFRAGARRGLRRGLTATFLIVITMLAWNTVGAEVRRWVRGEVALDGSPQFTPRHEPDPEALARIDFERLHTERIPRWTVALANATSPYWERRADEVFNELADEVAPDPNLAELFGATHHALRDHDPLAYADRLDYWLWAYNRYLDEQHIPWRLEATLDIGEARPVLFTRSYQIVADVRTEDGHRLRLLQRADGMNGVEGWLGRTGNHDEGAMVLMRQVLHFTVRHVWPALHPALEERRPSSERAWLAPVREEVRAQLYADAFELLSESAEDQQALIEVTASIRARAALCHHRPPFDDLPYNGLSARDVDRILRALQRSERRACPEITLDEVVALFGASERLAQLPGIETALEELTMVVARSVAVHELRHAMDGEALACPGCPEGLTGLARDEVSGYIAGFSAEGFGYLALLHACSTPLGTGDVHEAARESVVAAILPFGCEGPILYGLYDVAQDLDARLFGERLQVSLPELPARVRLLPRRARLRASQAMVVPSETVQAVAERIPTPAQ